MNRLVVFLVVIAAMIGSYLWYRPLVRHNEAYRKRIMELETQVRREEMENRRLESHIHALQHDPATVEREVRQQLNWARPDETVVRFERLPPARPVIGWGRPADLR